MIPWGWRLREGLHPVQETLTELGEHVSAAQKLLERGDGPRKVPPHPQDDLQIVLEDSQTINGRCRHGRRTEERFTGLEGGIKLSGGHSQAYLVPQGELRQRESCEEALAEIKGLGMRKARMTRKALLRKLLEGEARLLVLPLFVALRRVLGRPSQGTTEKVEAQRHVLSMGLQAARVLGEQTQRRLQALVLLWRRKLLGVETPGEHLSECLEDRPHRGLQVMLWGRVLGADAPLDEHGDQEHA